MSVFDGRPDLLLLFVAQVAFIIVQILIYLRLIRAEKQNSSRVEMHAKTKTKTPAKRKLSRRAK
jgi:hypothetical protein